VEIQWLRGDTRMKGVKFVVDEEGKKKAVLIDLKKHRELWEDFYDTLRVKEREDEPRESFEAVKEKILNCDCSPSKGCI